MSKLYLKIKLKIKLMSWLKLLFIEHDIKTINSEGFFISYSDKCVKDFNKNSVINIPFLINGNYDLYKVELEIKKGLLIIFVYINFIKLKFLIKNNDIIPCRNELIEILKKNKQRFKFNEIYYNEIENKRYSEIQNNVDNLEILERKIKNKVIIKASMDDTIECNLLSINLDKQSFVINENKVLFMPKSYIVYDNLCFHRLVNIFKCCDKILIINKEGTINLNNYLHITTKNYKNIKTGDILNNKIVVIDYKLIKSRNYFKNYNNFHSTLDYTKSYDNYKQYIENKKNIKCFNVELFNFNVIIGNNILDLDNKNLLFILDKFSNTYRIFLENYTKDFTYKYYCKIKQLLFSKKTILDDLNLNRYFILNNILLNFNLNYNNRPNQIKITRLPKFKSNIIDSNIDIYGDIYIFEGILNKKRLTYDFKIDENIENVQYCPITYENLNNILRVQLDCGHCFSLFGFLNTLYFGSKCPCCQKELFETRLSIIGTKTNIYKLVFGNVLSEILLKDDNVLNLVIKNNLNEKKYITDLLNNRVKIFNNNLSKNIIFTTLENIEIVMSLNLNKHKNIHIHMIHDIDTNTFLKYKSMKIINNLDLNKNSVLNVIKCN